MTDPKRPSTGTIHRAPTPPASFSLTTLRQQLKTALAATTDRDLRGGLGRALKAIERHEQEKTGS